MAELTYADYLNLDTLLSLQVPRTTDSGRRAVILSEQFFVVAHQSCELWLKQIIADVEAASDYLQPEHGLADAESSVEFLERAAELLRILVEQVAALEKLPIRHFAEFRPYVGSASGAESEQFRHLDEFLGDDRRSGRLYEALTAAVALSGTSVGEVCRRGPEAGAYHRIVEALLDIGNRYWHWKLGHLTLMSKMIGVGPGTGGTSGADYLMARVTLPFTELRRLRGQLHTEGTAPTGLADRTTA
ncbi:tryptophan 2,3-dioxygenase family protein [Streptomyces sp. NBC_00448]|uniref:tryptophan 2,3-dioxygenase family protein n=1 Tax=Streptomyces sp. NBC_00448 TaxID=2903652 RepID=UPI002E23487D